MPSNSNFDAKVTSFDYYGDPNFYQPPPTVLPKSPICGRISFWIALLATSGLIAGFTMIGGMLVMYPEYYGRLDTNTTPGWAVAVQFVIVALLFFMPLMNCLGVILGFIGLFQASQKKLWTVLSMLANAVPPVFIVAVLAMGMFRLISNTAKINETPARASALRSVQPPSKNQSATTPPRTITPADFRGSSRNAPSR